MLVANLPGGSALWRAAGVDAGWTEEAHLLATVVDVLQLANWQRGGKGQKPNPLLRPTDLRAATERADREESRARAWLARHPAPEEVSE